MPRTVRKIPVQPTLSAAWRKVGLAALHLSHAAFQQLLPGRPLHRNHSKRIENGRSETISALLYQRIQGFRSDSSGHTRHSRYTFACSGGVRKTEKAPSISSTLRSTYEWSPDFPPERELISAKQVIADLKQKLAQTKTALTPTESTVETFVREGLTSKQIAQQMGISPRTVDTHRHNIRKKNNPT